MEIRAVDDDNRARRPFYDGLRQLFPQLKQRRQRFDDPPQADDVQERVVPFLADPFCKSAAHSPQLFVGKNFVERRAQFGRIDIAGKLSGAYKNRHVATPVTLISKRSASCRKASFSNNSTLPASIKSPVRPESAMFRSVCTPTTGKS